MKMRTIFGTSLALLLLIAPTSQAAGKVSIAQAFAKLDKLAENVIGNGDASTFKFDPTNFDMGKEVKEFKNAVEGDGTGCKFNLTIGRTENIAALKTDLYSGDAESTKKMAQILASMKKNKQLITILRLEWDGNEDNDASSESCSISVYKVFAVDGSGYTFDLNQTD